MRGILREKKNLKKKIEGLLETLKNLEVENVHNEE